LKTTFQPNKVAHVGLTLPADEIVIAHGKASFLKQEKIAKLLREGGGLASAPTPASTALP